MKKFLTNISKKNSKNRNKSYDKIAEKKGAKHMSMDDAIWQKIKHLDDGEIFKINRKVLDDAIQSGNKITLTSNPFIELEQGTTHARELMYLQKNGFTFIKVSEGVWNAVKQ